MVSRRPHLPLRLFHAAFTMPPFVPALITEKWLCTTTIPGPPRGRVTSRSSIVPSRNCWQSCFTGGFSCVVYRSTDAHALPGQVPVDVGVRLQKGYIARHEMSKYMEISTRSVMRFSSASRDNDPPAFFGPFSSGKWLRLERWAFPDHFES